MQRVGENVQIMKPRKLRWFSIASSRIPFVECICKICIITFENKKKIKMAHTSYLLEEYAAMIRLYYQKDNNATISAEVYAEQNPQAARFPDRNVIIRAVRRFEETGSVIPNSGREGGQQGLDPERQEEVVTSVLGSRRVSVRDVARTTGISKSSVQRIITEEGLHPFHFTKVQKLEPRDWLPRQRFCARVLQNFIRDPLFIPRVLWTDECTFTRDGVFNAHNYHYYDYENPHLTWDSKSQYRFKFNVWAGVTDDQLVSKSLSV